MAIVGVRGVPGRFSVEWVYFLVLSVVEVVSDGHTAFEAVEGLKYGGFLVWFWCGDKFESSGEYV